MAGLAYVQHSVSENCLQRAVFAAYAHCWQKAALGGTEIGVNFTSYFSKRNEHNTVRKTRHEAFLNSNCYWDWIKKPQEICQWKSLKLDQLSYAERSWEHFGLPIHNPADPSCHEELLWHQVEGHWAEPAARGHHVTGLSVCNREPCPSGTNGNAVAPTFT